MSDERRVNATHKSFIEFAVTQGLPYMDAESANQEIVRLTLSNMILQAKWDAMKMREVE